MLNFIVSTETFIFSDLTHWLIDSRLMTHDSLTHLTHKTSVLNTCRQTPGFWRPLLASEWSTWLEQLVKNIDMCQSKVCFILKGHNRHINFLQLLFILVSKICPLICKSIFFDLFWNVKHFLRLNKSNKGFRLFFILQSASCIWNTKNIFFCLQWFPAMFCNAGPSWIISDFCRMLNSDLQIQITKNGWHLKLKLHQLWQISLRLSQDCSLSNDYLVITFELA